MCDNSVVFDILRKNFLLPALVYSPNNANPHFHGCSSTSSCKGTKNTHKAVHGTDPSKVKMGDSFASKSLLMTINGDGRPQAGVRLKAF